jgi:hypothetical protein
MIAYFIFYALLGGISARYDKTVIGLLVTLVLAFTFGIHWLPLSLVEFWFGYIIGKGMREKEST